MAQWTGRPSKENTLAYKVAIHHAAQRQMLSLPQHARVSLAHEIDRLAETPRPAGCKKLRGTELWRLRHGRYRVVYFIDDDAKLVKINQPKENRTLGCVN